MRRGNDSESVPAGRKVQTNSLAPVEFCDRLPIKIEDQQAPGRLAQNEDFDFAGVTTIEISGINDLAGWNGRDSYGVASFGCGAASGS
ncbi:MAG: hypothetical protein QOC70_2195 [Verrucomicrobiota bacterium]|jgi:hypothetical protein